MFGLVIVPENFLGVSVCFSGKFRGIAEKGEEGGDDDKDKEDRAREGKEGPMEGGREGIRRKLAADLNDACKLFSKLI